MPEESTPWLYATSVACELGISAERVKRMIQMGMLRGRPDGSGRWVVDPVSVAEFKVRESSGKPRHSV